MASADIERRGAGRPGGGRLEKRERFFTRHARLVLSHRIEGLPEAARCAVAVPAAPARAAQVATVALRLGPASVKAPAT